MVDVWFIVAYPHLMSCCRSSALWLRSHSEPLCFVIDGRTWQANFAPPSRSQAWAKGVSTDFLLILLILIFYWSTMSHRHCDWLTCCCFHFFEKYVLTDVLLMRHVMLRGNNCPSSLNIWWISQKSNFALSLSPEVASSKNMGDVACFRMSISHLALEVDVPCCHVAASLPHRFCHQWSLFTSSGWKWNNAAWLCAQIYNLHLHTLCYRILYLYIYIHIF